MSDNSTWDQRERLEREMQRKVRDGEISLDQYLLDFKKFSPDYTLYVKGMYAQILSGKKTKDKKPKKNKG